jgi:hypothetical protein
MPGYRKERRGSVFAKKHNTRDEGLLSPYSLIVELLSLPRWLVEAEPSAEYYYKYMYRHRG